jgi:hypothetical protein
LEVLGGLSARTPAAANPTAVAPAITTTTTVRIRRPVVPMSSSSRLGLSERGDDTS